MSCQQRVIVIGAGVGGLVAALELAHQGLDVTVLETAARPGGKLRQVPIGALLLDAGPTVFTMRWVFDELFSQLGLPLADHLPLQRLNTLARHAWSEHERLDLFADAGQSAQAIGELAGPAEARRYLAFCARARLIYQTLDQPFLRSARPNPVSLAGRVGRRGAAGLARISPFSSMWRALGRYFRDPRLRQLFGRYATYCGSSPFMAPATLMLVAHVEQEGVWVLDGGMHRLAATLAQLASSRGASFRYGEPARELLIEGGRATAVRLAGGDTLQADAIVFNGDAAALSAGLLGHATVDAVGPTPHSARSLSAVTWNLVASARGFPLIRHNVFFSGDYATEFDDLFRRSGLPAEPTVYLCAQDRSDPGTSAPAGAERLLCLVNAPANGDAQLADEAALARCEASTFSRLERCGLRLDRDSRRTVRTTPADFNRLFPGSGGALYGRASHGWMASFARPGARSRLDGLYLAGGSVHPGPGVPMAALSGRQAAASVLADLGSALRRSRQ